MNVVPDLKDTALPENKRNEKVGGFELKWLLILAFVMVGCSIPPAIKPMEHYPEGFPHPIIYGSMIGVPPGYSLILHFDAKDKNGKTHPITREFKISKNDNGDGIIRYAFFLPVGNWAVKRFELYGNRNYGKPSLITREYDRLFIGFKMEDSIRFEFNTTKKGLHYLGRWELKGFENLDSLASPEIARFEEIKDANDVLSGHSIDFSLSIADQSEKDLEVFKARNPKFVARKSLATLPFTSIHQGKHPFEMVIGSMATSNHVHFNYMHQQMMKPQIPGF